VLVLALTAALIAPPLGVWQLFALVRRGRLVTNGQIFSWVGVLIAVSYLSFTHDFAQFSMTAHASGHTNFTIDAEVHYNEDPNSVMDEEGQLGLLPLTT